MDTPTLEKNIKDLQYQVEKYSKVKFQSTTALYLKNKYIQYTAIPVLTLIVLMIWRPSFVYNDVIVNDQNKKIFSFKKVFLISLIISFLIILGIFIYKYKKNL